MGAAAALVTGASQGIGEAIARRLAADGFAVGLVARGGERLEKLAAELRQAGHQALAYAGDVGVRADMDRVLADARRDLGAPHVLCNNAGWGGPFHQTHEVTDDEWERVLATNLGGVRLLSAALAPAMAAAGTGRIINISSVMGFLGGAGSSSYAAAKHAVIGYTRSLAIEWGAHGVTCNAVCPGYIATRMTSDDGGFYDDAKQREIVRPIPAGRMGTPAEVAALVSFLASPAASYCNGGVYTVDGGLTARLP